MQVNFAELIAVLQNQQSEVVMAPCLLPELHLLDEVSAYLLIYIPAVFSLNTFE